MSALVSLESARQETRQTILKYKIFELQSLISEIKTHKATIQQLDQQRNIIYERRQRLMAQNFSGAKHLEKTHTKYWRTYTATQEKLKREIRTLQYKREELRELRSGLQNHVV